jgi:hypothetical protein
MEDRITDRGAEAERIEDTGAVLPRIGAAEFAAGLGAEPCGDNLPRGVSLLSLADLGNDLLKRLRAGGGRCVVKDSSPQGASPLSQEDMAALTDIIAAIERATGARPSLGQIARVVVRMHADALRSAVCEESRAANGE